MHVLLKIGLEVPRCVTYFRGSQDVLEYATGGSKLGQNSVAYFMDGPWSILVGGGAPSVQTNSAVTARRRRGVVGGIL